MESFPPLPADGNRVIASNFIAEGTGTALLVGSIVAGLLGLIPAVVLICVTYGIALIGFLISPLFFAYQNRKALALIHGSGIKVSADQFPSIHQAVAKMSERLGITAPDVYLVEANVLNAFAVKYGKKNVILVTDDLVHGAVASGRVGGLTYVLAHELAHVALGQNGFIRSFIRARYKKLSRLDEYSADAVAVRLVSDKADAVAGLVMLTVGPHLAKYLNGQALAAQITEVAENKYSQKAERVLTHPLLLNRLDRIMRANG